MKKISTCSVILLIAFLIVGLTITIGRPIHIKKHREEMIQLLQDSNYTNIEMVSTDCINNAGVFSTNKGIIKVKIFNNTLFITKSILK